MTDVRVGFIGAGRMAEALISGFISGNLVKAEHIIASSASDSKFKTIAQYGARTLINNVEATKASDLIIIAVKPHIVIPVLQEISSHVTKDKLVVSVAAGINIATMAEHLQPGTRIIRVMPNTPSLVSCGVSVYSPGENATEADCELVQKLLTSVGICERMPEKYLDPVSGLSGAGPAYAFLAIEALADGGVRVGLPRDVAQKLAAQTLMGAAKMVLETGKHPGELKDAVCSPGGATIEGIHELEKGGTRASFMNAVKAATDKSRQLGKI